MGNYFSKSEEPLIDGVDENLRKRTLARIKQSNNSFNGVLCNSCGAALVPTFNNRVKIPFYCNVCVITRMGIQGTYGILSLIDVEDRWLSTKQTI